MKNIKYVIISLILLSIATAQTSSITVGGTGTAATSAHITVGTDGYRCPDEYVVESGASLTTWDPSAICDASTSGEGDITLPVELTSFTVETTIQGVLCEWTTESEIENLGFMLERKTEGTNWIEIASYKTDNGLLGQGSISSATDYEYLDNLVGPNTTYEYRLSDVDYNGIVTYHATRTVTVEQTPIASMVKEFTVLPAYPNPFNPVTTITYGIDTDNKVTINIYDITGQLITTLLSKEQSHGWYSIQWNGTNQLGKTVPNGQYFVKVISGNREKVQKLMLLK